MTPATFASEFATAFQSATGSTVPVVWGELELHRHRIPPVIEWVPRGTGDVSNIVKVGAANATKTRQIATLTERVDVYLWAHTDAAARALHGAWLAVCYRVLRQSITYEGWEVMHELAERAATWQHGACIKHAVIMATPVYETPHDLSAILTAPPTVAPAELTNPLLATVTTGAITSTDII